MFRDHDPWNLIAIPVVWIVCGYLTARDWILDRAR